MHLQNYWIKSLRGKAVLFLSFFVLLSADLLAQVSGVIQDESNETLIGVNVFIKSKPSVGTISNIDGAFTIAASPGEILVFSYLGYEDLEVPVEAGVTEYAVTMSVSDELLKEVVVVGYGAVDKKDLTGVVTKVGEEEFNKGVMTSPEKLLNGKVAGLQITNNGEPGGGSRIRLRGASGLSTSPDPLVVIDGVPMQGGSGRNPYSFVNASDVADITVLKDASATAIYGSRGANGVIIITTKSGSAGKLKVSYTGNANWSTFVGNTGFLSRDNFVALVNNKAPQALPIMGDANTDWFDEVTQDAISTEHNLSLSGGKKAINYRLSGSFLNNNGILRYSKHQKITGAANIGIKLFDDLLDIDIRSKASVIDENYNPNVTGAALAYDPTQPVFDTASIYGGYRQWAPDVLATNNPVSTQDLNNNVSQINRYLNSATIKLNLPFVEGLSLNSNVSYDYEDAAGDVFSDPLLWDNNNYANGGFLKNWRNLKNTTLIETYGGYNREFKEIKSKVQLTAGHSWQETNFEGRSDQGNQLLQDGGDWIYTDQIENDSTIVSNRLISFYGRMNYTFNEKYLLTASLRRDGSTRFGDGNKWGLFPAVALGWRVLEEPFMSGLKNTFSNLKLRVSYGVTGNEQIGDFQYTTYYSYGSEDAAYQFGDNYVQTLRGRGVDPNLKWEETTSTNIGLDFGFFKNRLSGTIDFYNKYTNDLLFVVATSAFTNLSDRVLTNIGEMENKGIELGLNAVVIDSKGIDWNISLNAAVNKNEIIKLDNSNLPDFLGYETGGISGDIGQTIQVLRVGNPVNAFRTYTHILDANGLPLVDTEDHNGDGFINGLDIYEDINGDGIINENDLVISNNGDPKLLLGMTSNLSYRNWSLDFTLRANFGNYVYNNVASASGFYQRLTERKLSNVHESVVETNFNERQLKSDYYIEEASFLKLDNVTIRYNLPSNKVFDNMGVFLTASNLLTITNYSGMDPEIPQFSSGIDNNIYPISLSVLFGVNANF